MKNYKIYLLFILLLLSLTKISAQSYNTAFGLRFGGLSNGLTVKSFIHPSDALEGILSVGHQSFIITGLYERHTGVDASTDFKLFYGGGAHIGFFQDGGSYYYNSKRIYTATTVAGIDGILGFDYKFNKAPINFSMDIKPFIDFFNGNFIYFDGGFSIRYTF
jgi:hypothetical protein